MSNRSQRRGGVGARLFSLLLAALLMMVFLFQPSLSARAESPAADGGEWQRIVDVIAGNGFTVALRADGKVLYAGEDYFGAAERIADWENIGRIEVQHWGWYLIGYTRDGGVRLEALYDWETYNWGRLLREEDFSAWNDVKQIILDYDYCLGLTNQGTVLVLPLEEEWVEFCREITGWSDVRQLVSSGYSAVLGLKEDGTVLCAEREDMDETYKQFWSAPDAPKNIRELVPGSYGIYAIDEEGTVVFGVSGPEWTNIEKLYFASDSMFGLRRDGTVAVLDFLLDDERIQEVASWDSIVELGFDVTGWARYVPVGLREDGTVCAVMTEYYGGPYGDWDTTGWTDVQKLFSGTDYTIGVRSDGSLLVTGGEFGWADWLEEVAGWTDIQAIFTSSSDEAPGHIIGLKTDGTLIAAGDNSFGQCEVGG